MAKLSVLPIPLKERHEHGSREAIERVREQARVQIQGRTESKLVHEPLLPMVEGMSLCRLAQPSANDLFVDIEGDPFAGESGEQYLFGFAFKDATGEMCYEKRWALNRAEEKKGFEWVINQSLTRREAQRTRHCYHLAAQ